MAESKSIFGTLSAIDVSSKIYDKNGFSYIPWAIAWSMLKDKYPDAQRTVYESEAGMPYFSDGAYAHVKVGVTVGGIEHIDYLPVIDYRNKSIPIENITSFDINKSIQRSTVKAIAMHGLGISLWMKDDGFPEVVVSAEEAMPNKENKEDVDRLPLEVDDANWPRVVRYIEGNVEEMSLADIVTQLRRKYVVNRVTKKAIKEYIDELTNKVDEYE